MPEQFERLLDVLRGQGLLGRCECIQLGEVRVVLQPEQPAQPPVEKQPTKDPRRLLIEELNRSFPNAVLPKSLRMGGE